MAGSRPLFDLFQSRVVQNRPEVALDFGKQRVTYGELLVRVEDLADRISSHHGGAPSTVLIGCAKSPALFEAYLACCLLDATVVPVEPELPEPRVRELIELSGCTHALRTASSAVESAASDLPSLAWAAEGGWSARPGGLAPEPDRDRADLPDAAYILFTSGSTGVPKGVPVSAANVLAYLDAYLPGVRPGGRFSQTFSISFDLSVHDIFVTLGSGGTLCVPRGREQVHLSSYVGSREITRLFIVPSAVDVAARLGGLDAGSMQGLEVISLCGEGLHWRQVDLLRAAAPDAVIENLYGPSEMTIACFRNVLGTAGSRESGVGSNGVGSNGVVPIGQPLPGVEWELRREPDGDRDVGELLLRGAQRFGGYLDPSLNRAAFETGEQAGSCGFAPPSWWYRSGDLVRVTPDTLEFLGRIDDQLKVLGHRIEPLEAEAVLAKHELVGSACVVKVATPTERLAAMYTGSLVGSGELVRFMRERLPAYMVPEVFVHVDALPTNANGKLDRKSIRGELERL